MAHVIQERELFAPLCQLQLPSHCGPCSLSACLFILGTTATQRQPARAAIRLVDHFGPWVAVIGYLRARRRFIIVDPKDEASVSRLWPEQTLIRRGWNANGAPPTGEPDQFFAILLARADGGPARWEVSEAWLRLCERGSDQTAEGMANDLTELARLASPGRGAISDGPYLAELIEEYRDRILDSITHWAQGSGTRDLGDLRTFFRDYEIVASATGIRVAKGCDRAYLVAQLTALLCSYWWGARF